MRTVQIPHGLKEVLGERQSPWLIAVVFGMGIALAALLAALDPGLWEGLPAWRQWVALALSLDIVSGCLANFTRGTNRFYAASPRRRWWFLAVHEHVLVLAWVLNQPMGPAVAVWAYTLASAALVHTRREHEIQQITAGAALTLGLVWIAAAVPAPGSLRAVYLLFLLKLALCFAVNHYRGTDDDAAV